MRALMEIVSKERLRRLGAFALDMVILALLLQVSVAFFHRPDFGQVQQEIDLIVQMPTPEAQQTQMTHAMAGFQRAYILAVAIWIGYEIVAQLLLNGRTVGKLVFGLRVASRCPTDGTVKSLLRMTVRSLAKGLLLFLFRGLPILISWVYILGNDANRAGYDCFTGTQVVNAKRRELRLKAAVQ